MQIVHLGPGKKSAIAQFKKEMDTYTLLNCTHCADTPILSIQEYMAVISPVTVQKSNAVYMQVLDAKSESKDSLMTIFLIYTSISLSNMVKNFLVLTADAKLYEVIYRTFGMFCVS